MEIRLRFLSALVISLLNLTLCCSYTTSEPKMVTLTREPQLLSRLESKLLQLAGLKERPAVRRKRSITSFSDSSSSFSQLSNSFSSNSENSVNSDSSNSNVQYLKVPKHLIDLYEKSNGNLLETTNLYLPGRFTKNANTVRTFYPNEPNQDSNKLHFKFTLDNIPVTETVLGAELHLSINLTSVSIDSTMSKCQLPLRILINDVTKKVKPNKEPIMYPIDTKLVRHLEKAKTLSFDIFPAVSRWLETPKANHGLILSVFSQNSDDHSHNGNKNILEECGISISQPILFTYSDDRLYNKRSARSAQVLSRKYRAAQQQQSGQRKGKGRGRGHKHKNRKRNLCAKHKMFVDFTEVGWNDWIVAPPGYHAHHCAGECPFPMADHLNATNHAVIQALVNSMNPQLVPPPCCVPTKYSSLSLLYTDSSDKIVLKNYNEMVVDACGCS